MCGRDFKAAYVEPYSMGGIAQLRSAAGDQVRSSRERVGIRRIGSRVRRGERLTRENANEARNGPAPNDLIADSWHVAEESFALPHGNIPHPLRHPFVSRDEIIFTIIASTTVRI